MAIARFKDLYIDADDPARLGGFWAEVLDRTWEPKEDGAGLVSGPTPQHTIWINQVPDSTTTGLPGAKAQIDEDPRSLDGSGVLVLGG
jgi:hypothetical protein